MSIRNRRAQKTELILQSVKHKSATHALKFFSCSFVSPATFIAVPINLLCNIALKKECMTSEYETIAMIFPMRNIVLTHFVRAESLELQPN